MYSLRNPAHLPTLTPATWVLGFLVLLFQLIHPHITGISLVGQIYVPCRSVCDWIESSDQPLFKSRSKDQEHATPIWSLTRVIKNFEGTIKRSSTLFADQKYDPGRKRLNRRQISDYPMPCIFSSIPANQNVWCQLVWTFTSKLMNNTPPVYTLEDKLVYILIVFLNEE